MLRRQPELLLQRAARRAGRLRAGLLPGALLPARVRRLEPQVRRARGAGREGGTDRRWAMPNAASRQR